MHEVRVAVRENVLSSPDRITEADYVDAIETRGRGWVIERNGRVVAFAAAYAAGSIWALFVDPQHEGHGLGRALHDEMVAWLWSLGLTSLSLSTSPGTRAERFYIARGWRPCGVTEDGEVLFELHAG